jgi:hypothetical protein
MLTRANTTTTIVCSSCHIPAPSFHLCFLTSTSRQICVAGLHTVFWGRGGGAGGADPLCGLMTLITTTVTAASIVWTGMFEILNQTSGNPELSCAIRHEVAGQASGRQKLNLKLADTVMLVAVRVRHSQTVFVAWCCIRTEVWFAY